jgi:triphosphatase
VALRRLRALLKVFSPLLPPAFFASYNEGWRHFANQLGDARDHDVLVEETLPAISRHFDGYDVIERFVAHAQDCRLEARESARACFHQPALGQLALRFLADLTRLAPGPTDPSLNNFAEQALKRRLKRVRRDSRHFDRKRIDELHRLRIQFKRLRYTLDFFAPLCPPGEAKAYGAALKAIQDLLGRINDQERALSIESIAPDAVRCELVAGWLSASQQSLIAALPAIADQFTSLAAPWEGAERSKGKRK